VGFALDNRIRAALRFTKPPSQEWLCRQILLPVAVVNNQRIELQIKTRNLRNVCVRLKGIGARCVIELERSRWPRAGAQSASALPTGPSGESSIN
jgi:hypothetical protein